MLLLPIFSEKVHCLDGRARHVYEVTAEHARLEDICRMLPEFERAEVEKILAQLLKLGLVETTDTSESRRKFLLKAAGLVGGAIITSVLAPRPAGAASLTISAGCNLDTMSPTNTVCAAAGNGGTAAPVSAITTCAHRLLQPVPRRARAAPCAVGVPTPSIMSARIVRARPISRPWPAADSAALSLPPKQESILAGQSLWHETRARSQRPDHSRPL